MKESAIVARIVRRLKQAGVWCYKVHGSAMSRAGVPDLICCVNGSFVAIEVKTEEGRVSVRQRVEVEAIKRAGGHAVVTWGMTAADATVDGILARFDP